MVRECRIRWQAGITEQTYDRWHKNYGGLKVDRAAGLMHILGRRPQPITPV